tara:strand:- start:10520 stop:10771 length:252 start_codon:yes stop_codon:yes gene_type:complete
MDECFNPRAREGRDGIDVEVLKDWLVSIHAPARGATVWNVAAGPSIQVSIHAPARGATARHGVDRRRRRVSIHAPARGATQQW